MAEKKTTPRDDRTRNWTFLVYPSKAYLDGIGSEYDGSDGYGSAPDGWRELLDEQHIAWVESPLHDKDVNPDGLKKKPHWHVLLLFPGNKSYTQIKEITDALNTTIPQKAENAKGLVRYMAHLDHPDKAQYSRSEIIGHGGVDVAEYLKPTNSNRYQLIGEMRQWVEDSGCIEFCALFDYAAAERFDDWFPLLCDNSAYIMGEYIKSHRHGRGGGVKVVKVDRETGEIVE